MKKKIRTIQDLTPDPRNANKHTQRGMALLEKSLQRYGAGRSILAAADGVVLAGNATLEEAASAGMPVKVVETDGKELVVVQRTDIDSQSKMARGLKIADNRVAEVNLAWDAEALAEEKAEGVDVGEFFFPDELDRLSGPGDPDAQPTPGGMVTPYESIGFGEGGDAKPPDIPEPVVTGKMRGPARTVGSEAARDQDVADLPLDPNRIQKMNDDVVFPSSNWYGIPDLRRDRIVEELPKPIKTWYGSKNTPDDGETWWVYNYGTCAVSGIPWQRTILSFFTWDYKFENWWSEPSEYVERLRAAGCTMAICPDFSLWAGEPRAVQIYNTFRSIWLGRFIQEGGLKLIPILNWADQESFEKYSFLGVPRDTPTLALTLQNQKNDEDRERCLAGLRRIAESYEIRQLLCCCGKPGRALLEQVDWRDTEIVYVATTSEMMTAAKERRAGLRTIKLGGETPPPR